MRVFVPVGISAWLNRSDTLEHFLVQPLTALSRMRSGDALRQPARNFLNRVLLGLEPAEETQHLHRRLLAQT